MANEWQIGSGGNFSRRLNPRPKALSALDLSYSFSVFAIATDILMRVPTKECNAPHSAVKRPRIASGAAFHFSAQFLSLRLHGAYHVPHRGVLENQEHVGDTAQTRVSLYRPRDLRGNDLYTSEHARNRARVNQTWPSGGINEEVASKADFSLATVPSLHW